MSYLRNEMLYDDGAYYVWEATNDDLEQGVFAKSDQSELNRRSGSEVLGFINQLGLRYWSHSPSVKTFQKIEKMIRHHVPPDINVQRRVADWIILNWAFH